MFEIFFLPPPINFSSVYVSKSQSIEFTVIINPNIIDVKKIFKRELLYIN